MKRIRIGEFDDVSECEDFAGDKQRSNLCKTHIATHSKLLSGTPPDSEASADHELEILSGLDTNDESRNTKPFRNQKPSYLGPKVFKTPKLAAKVEPFKLEWAMGFNRDAKIISLCCSNERTLFFALTQCGVIYNVNEKRMQFLQGHPNKIISISSTYDGKFLVTADSGPENIVVIWQRCDITPVMIYFDPYKGQRIMYAALSPKGNYMVSLGEYDEEDIKIDFRLWTEGNDEVDGSTYIRNYFGKVICINFNPNKTNNFVILFERAAVFLSWDENIRELSEPIIPSIKYKGRLGYLTDVTYIEHCNEILVTTSEGCIIFFGTTLYHQNYRENEIETLMTLKICKISKVSLNTIDSADGVVITGDDNGIISIFDRRLRLIFWYDEYMDTPIYTIKFNLIPRKYRLMDHKLNDKNRAPSRNGSNPDDDLYEFQDDSDKYETIYKNKLKNDASIVGEKWVISDFLVVIPGTVTLVEFISGIHTVLYNRGYDQVGAMTVHDEFTYIVIGYKNGFICLVNYMNSFVHIVQNLPTAYDKEDNAALITALEYSSRSLYLACGRSNGELWFLDPILLTSIQEPVTLSNTPINHIVFSADNTQLAFSNTKTTVYLMIYKKSESAWIFIGKTRSHYKSISSIFFFPSDPKNLISIAKDRFMAIYNNVNIQLGDEFRAISRVRIDQTAVPLSSEIYPCKHRKTSYRYLIVADDQHKYKLINEATQMCRFVAQGPAFGCYQGTPVKKIKMLPENNDNYMIYITQKHLGVQKLPVTGNPYSFVGCYGHPDELMDFEVSGDGDFIFTIGKDDSTVLRWRTNTKGVDLMQNLGGLDFEPLYCVIEGGKNGFLFQEMQDLFFYMQILHEGENSTLPRRVSDKLAVTELPDLMRACGYYPTDFEIETFMVDIKYRSFDEDGSTTESVTFLDFVELYLNHKPVYGYPLDALRDTFITFTNAVDNSTPGIIKRDDFIELMTEEGEPFSLSQINKCMEILLAAQVAPEGGHYLFDFIPELIDCEIFEDDFLGIDMRRVEIDVENDEEQSENYFSSRPTK